MCQPGRISACQVAIALAFVTLLGGVAHAFTIASESFPYVAGSILDGQGSGFGWDTGAFVNGQMTGGCQATVPSTYGHSGASWVTSSTYGANAHNRIGASSLAYPGVVSAGNMLVEVDGSLHGGVSGLRAFRTVGTSAAGLTPYLTNGLLGHGSIYLAFLARIDPVTCNGTLPCVAPVCSANAAHDAGIHLFQGFGDLTACADGPKHPYEHLFMGDQNRTNVWSVARTTGGGTGAWIGISTLPIDNTARLYLLRLDFDTNQACAPTGADLNVCPPSGTTVTNCGGATTGNETLTLWVDPDLTAPIDLTKAPVAKVGPVSVYNFAFDTIEVGGEGETLDLDELRIGTRVEDVVDDHPYCANDADCAADPQGRTHCDATPGIAVCVVASGSTTSSTAAPTTTLTTSTTTVTSTTTTAPTSTTTSTIVTTTTTAAATTTTATTSTSTTTVVSSTTTTTLGACTPVPRLDCDTAAPHGAHLTLTNVTLDANDRVRFKWVAGGAVSPAEFGSPSTSTGFAVCLYDALGIRSARVVPAGGVCGNVACWRVGATRMRYDNPAATPDGIGKIRLTAGVVGHARIGVAGRGDNLHPPLLPLTVPVLVQVQRTDGGACFAATFSSAPRRNDTTRLAATSD